MAPAICGPSWLIAVDVGTDFGLSWTPVFQWRRVEYPSQTKPSRMHVWQSSMDVSGIDRSQNEGVIVPGSPLSQNALRVTQVQHEPSFSSERTEGLPWESTRLPNPFMFVVVVVGPSASSRTLPLSDESTVCSFPCSAEELTIAFLAVAVSMPEAANLCLLFNRPH